MAHKSPGKSDREGITLVELCDMFPTEESARDWFESRVWPDGRHCPHCGSIRTHEAKHRFSPYRCTDCRGYFSVKTGTVMHKSQVPLRKWVFAIYLHLTSLKGVSSMKCTGILVLVNLQHGSCFSASARHGMTTTMGHLAGRWKWTKRTSAQRAQQALKQEAQGRSRRCWQDRRGGRQRSRDQQGPRQGRRKDRRRDPTEVRDRRRRPWSTVYTDDAAVYKGMPTTTRVSITVSASLSAGWPTQTVWRASGPCSSADTKAPTTRSAPSTCNATSTSSRGVTASRDLDTLVQMGALARGMVGKRLRYRDLIADTGPGARG